MQLTSFIEANHQSILKGWVEFAGSMLPWAEGSSEKELLDHAKELLVAVVDDMKSPQTKLRQSAKSKGQTADGTLARVGKKHASDRLESGLSLKQLVSEFRALRTSVLQQWEKSKGSETGEVTRFNEAIDETLATSICRYTEIVDHTREQFLAILSHDLRSPLGAIIMGANLLKDSEIHDPVKIIHLILGAAERMNRMVSDLLDFTRTRLGAGIPVTKKPMDLASVCLQVIAELQRSHPKTPLCFKPSGDLRGEWDSDRIAQVVSNLVSNALQYGETGKPVGIEVREQGPEILLKVHNEGLPIPETALNTIFMPMARYQAGGKCPDKNSQGLGLGLYIASEIVMSHGGDIDVESNEVSGTTFTVTLPRGQVNPMNQAARRETNGAATQKDAPVLNPG